MLLCHCDPQIDWKFVIDVVVALIAVLGFLLSLFFSMKTLKEVQRDRRLTVRPNLIFELGGHLVSLEFKKEKDGRETIHPYWARSGDHVQPQYFGTLTNFGSGAAYQVKGEWIADKITRGQNTMVVTDDMRKDGPFDTESNWFISIPQHVKSNSIAHIQHLPWFIALDYDKSITRVDGRLRLEYRDTLNNNLVSFQEFRIFTDYPNRRLTVTFSDILQMPQ